MKKFIIIILCLFCLVGCISKGEKEFKAIKSKKECECIYSDALGVTCECHIAKEEIPETKRLMKELKRSRKP